MGTSSQIARRRSRTALRLDHPLRSDIQPFSGEILSRPLIMSHIQNHPARRHIENMRISPEKRARCRRYYTALSPCFLLTSPTSSGASGHGIFRESWTAWLDLRRNLYANFPGMSDCYSTKKPVSQRSPADVS